jgi:hypothetical protein
MNPTALIAYYTALLILQYNDKPKARATISTIVDAEVANMVISQVEGAFDISTAVGVQLDAIAKYVGAQRVIYGLSISTTYFQFRLAADAAPPATTWNGFATAAHPVTAWFFLDVQDFDSNVQTLTDGQLRMLVEYLAALESTDFTVEETDDIFSEFFGTYVTWTDHMNMTMTITHDNTNDPDTLFEIVKFLGAFPRPAGVALNVVEI